MWHYQYRKVEFCASRMAAIFVFGGHLQYLLQNNFLFITNDFLDLISMAIGTYFVDV
jgi:hypothetical protein